MAAGGRTPMLTRRDPVTDPPRPRADPVDTPCPPHARAIARKIARMPSSAAARFCGRIVHTKIKNIRGSAARGRKGGACARHCCGAVRRAPRKCARGGCCNYRLLANAPASMAARERAAMMAECMAGNRLRGGRAEA